MSILGSVISAGAGLPVAASSDKASAKAAQQAQQHSDKQLKNRHQWEVADLRKAGLNPILSAGALLPLALLPWLKSLIKLTLSQKLA